METEINPERLIREQTALIGPTHENSEHPYLGLKLQPRVEREEYI